MQRAMLIFLMTGILVSLFIILGLTRATSQPQTGEVLFQQNCAACHANGGNVINPQKPLKDGPSLKSFATFLPWIRKPVQPMPAFPPSTISDRQAKELYDYILAENKTAWK
jgi:mono/diheme cytochrome c family protein